MNDIFWNYNFGGFQDIAKKLKWQFWNSEIKLVQNTHFFTLKYQFENLGICDSGLTWPVSVVDLHGGQIAKWHLFLNSTCQTDYKSCIAFLTKFFYDPSWPDLGPDPYSPWHLYSKGIFTSPLRSLCLSFEQKLSISPALGFVIQKRQNLTVDLNLTRELTSILKS